jgi:class 3 adenylate cyclase
MGQEDFKRKLAAILSADVTEYSRLMREDESATIRTLTSYREVMAGLIKQHHGRVVDAVGDNLLAEFASVVDAVQGAIAIQKELKSRNAQVPEGRRMLFRIGINLGDLVVEGDRIYGDGVNIAARLEAMADPGGICISRTAFDQIEDKLPLGYEYLGERTVKNITKPVRAYRVLFDPEDPKPGRISRRKRRIGPGKRVRPTGYEIRKGEAAPGIWGNSLLRRHILAFTGVTGFLIIINVLAWDTGMWFYWPALSWGLFLYLHWVNTAKKDGVKDRSKALFHKHLRIYSGVIGFLIIVNVLTWDGMIWCHWPAIGWGLLVFFHWIKAKGRP